MEETNLPQNREKPIIREKKEGGGLKKASLFQGGGTPGDLQEGVGSVLTKRRGEVFCKSNVGPREKEAVEGEKKEKKRSFRGRNHTRKALKKAPMGGIQKKKSPRNRPKKFRQCTEEKKGPN